MKYFKDCATIQEGKALYKKLALENHPDRGGNLEIMKAINVEYDFFTVKMLQNAGKSKEEINDELNLNKAYTEAINNISGLDNIIIELVGSWLWVTGETKKHREIFKRAGFKFASKKIAWFFRTDENKSTYSKGSSLDDIRGKYGAINIKTNKKVSLN